MNSIDRYTTFINTKNYAINLKQTLGKKNVDVDKTAQNAYDYYNKTFLKSQNLCNVRNILLYDRYLKPSNKNDSEIYIKNFHRFINNPTVKQILKDAKNNFKTDYHKTWKARLKIIKNEKVTLYGVRKISDLKIAFRQIKNIIFKH